MQSTKIDQTAQMRRLIWVFAGHKTLIVGLVVDWLKCEWQCRNRRNTNILPHRLHVQQAIKQVCGIIKFYYLSTDKWSKSTCPTKIYLLKIVIFFLFLEENICCGYSLEVPQWGTSNKYPQHMFSLRNKKNIHLIIWILSLARSINYLSQDK